MKKTLKFIFIMFLLIVGFSDVKAQVTPSGDYIKNFDIKMNIDEHGKVHVTQKIDVYLSGQKHGIYANIPTITKIKNPDGTMSQYYLPVTNVKVKDHNFKVDNQNEGVQLIIGDENKYLSQDQSFIYSYDMQLKDFKHLKDEQLLYFNLIGNQWKLDILKTHFRITMPKPFQDKAKIYTKGNRIVESKINGNTITGSYGNKVRQGETLSVYLKLPPNYFTFPIDYSNFIADGFIVGLLLLLLFTVVSFFKYGKEDIVVKVINYAAPEGLSSAMIAYIYKEEVSFQDVGSMIVYWASQGLLDIEEEDDEQENLKFTKLDDNKEAPLLERMLFDKLFSQDDIVYTDHLPEGFGTYSTDISSSYKAYLNKHYHFYERKSDSRKYLIMTITFILIALYSLIINFSFYQNLSQIMFIKSLFTMIALVIAFFGVQGLLRFNRQRGRTRYFFAIIALIFLLLFSFLFYFIILYGIIDIIGIVLSYIIIVVIAITNTYMDKRSKEGNELYGNVLGFKEFIETAEKDRLEMLVKDNPSYFYDVLPYAHVFGLSNKWMKKFEHIKIEQPSWYYSNAPFMNNYLFMMAITNNMNHMAGSVYSSIPGSSGGSGGFTGGGGGFSGGGFGGGGGGSW